MGRRESNPEKKGKEQIDWGPVNEREEHIGCERYTKGDLGGPLRSVILYSYFVLLLILFILTFALKKLIYKDRLFNNVSNSNEV